MTSQHHAERAKVMSNTQTGRGPYFALQPIVDLSGFELRFYNALREMPCIGHSECGFVHREVVGKPRYWMRGESWQEMSEAEYAAACERLEVLHG